MNPFLGVFWHRSADTSGRCLGLVLVVMLAGIAGLHAEVPNPQPKTAPPLTHCLKIRQDAAGKLLQEAFVWRDSAQDPQGVAQGVALGLRRSFDLVSKPPSAVLRLFADARYILWVNGTYVERGPARFQPNGPEYDLLEIGSYLKPGKNTVALLVFGNLSGGKVMRHRPGVTASLEIDGAPLWKTDEEWRWSDKTKFRSVGASWANLGETEVDARVEDGDWTLPDYNDEAWNRCVRILGDVWGPLTVRRIPRLREGEVKVLFPQGVTLPVTLKEGEKLDFQAERLVQAYPVIEFEADEGTELTVEPFGFRYHAKAGPQRHMALDTRGFMKGSLSVVKGKITLTGFRLVERLYPFDRLASFRSDDPFLNHLWDLCARSCEVLSEDSYVDCADRERVEWMDNTPPGFDVTRTAMAGPAADGGKVPSDPRLLAELIRRTALTLQPEGWVKAHTCSDRYDIHAKMEDRACDWVEGIRLYHEATGDAAAVREIWPAVKSQMEDFLAHRTGTGLVSARDWVVWKNPTGYLTGQTTPLNSFIARALSDASALAGIAGDGKSAKRYAKASEDLKAAINRTLWDGDSRSYFGGYFSRSEIAANAVAKISFKSKEPLESRLKKGYFPPTLEANLFALDRGVVPEERRKQVIDMVTAEVAKGNVGGGIMTAYYLFKQLYALDRPEFDRLILDLMRKKFQAMADSPLGCSWESYTGGSKAHIYGMYPGYFLSAYVLGVRRDDPFVLRKLLIEPHLGNLNRAEGTVMTEFGPVEVSWTMDGGRLRGEITIPEGVKTTLALPVPGGSGQALLDGKPITGTEHGSRLLMPLSPGKHLMLSGSEAPAAIPASTLR
jgi:hypothetical protein